MLDAHRCAHHSTVGGVPDGELAGGEVHQVALLEVDEAVGDRSQGQRVGGDEVLADADADHEWAAGAGGDDPTGIFAGHHAERVGAFEALDRLADGFEEVALLIEAMIDEVCDDLRIGVRLQFVACIEEFVAQLLEVLDDAVVYEADAPPRQVRMGVLDRRSAVRRPARVRDAGDAVDRRVAQTLH